MNINDIDTLEKLKIYSSFKDVKIIFLKNFRFSIKARSWKSLFHKLNNIKQIMNNNLIELFDLGDTLSYSKRQIEKKLSIKSHAKNKNQLKNDYDKLMIFFQDRNLNPYEEFEKNKIKNFKYSSKLEGIDIENTNQSLSEIIQKHTVTSNG